MTRKSDAGERIAKVMARAGLCSRRDAEEWIAAGRVAVNGGIISSPAVNVTAGDRITVDGKPLPRRERTRLFLYCKAVGLVSTNTDPQGRPTVFDALPANLPRLVSVGRLDITSEGLLLLTNDGGLARALELPETAWVRRYRVRAHGRVAPAAFEALRDGVTIEGIHYGPIEATLEREQGANIWLGFAIREGKNREVRNVLAHLGLQVNRLIRVAFGPFGLGELAEGAIEEVETGNLRRELGPRIAALAGADFAGPAHEVPAASREARPDKRAGKREDGRKHRREDRRQGKPEGRREGRRFEKGFEKPPGRPRRGHAWRKDDAPLRRTYRGSRRDDLKLADAARPDKRAGLLEDRKGRRILVERFGAKPAEPVEAPAPAKKRAGRRATVLQARGRRGPNRSRAKTRATGAPQPRPRSGPHRTRSASRPRPSEINFSSRPRRDR